MSQVFKGFIAKINEKSGRGRRGPWTVYSIKLENDDGTEIDGWISAGFDKPSVKEGDYVKITAQENNEGYLNATEIKPLKNAPQRASKGSKNANRGTAGAGPGNTQQSIHYQNSRTTAVNVIQLLLENSALPLIASKGKAADAKRYDEIMALIDKLTVRFYNDVETLRILDSVVDEGTPPEADGQLPNDSDAEDDDDSDEEEESDDEGDDE
jgi:hypothetical protein